MPLPLADINNEKRIGEKKRREKEDIALYVCANKEQKKGGGYYYGVYLISLYVCLVIICGVSIISGKYFAPISGKQKERKRDETRGRSFTLFRARPLCIFYLEFLLFFSYSGLFCYGA